jgi:hypothetical protein
MLYLAIDQHRKQLTVNSTQRGQWGSGVLRVDRGDLNQEKAGIGGTPVAEEDSGLDPLGNWTDYVQKTNGSIRLDQDRDHNMANEVTDITKTTGPAWVTPAHDRAGNMTTMPWPTDPTVEMDRVYDAWNRLVLAEEIYSGWEFAYQYNSSWQVGGGVAWACLGVHRAGARRRREAADLPRA